MFLNYWGVGNVDIRQYGREQWMLMKQVLFLITLAEDRRYTFIQIYNPCLKSCYIYNFLHTDDLGVSRTCSKQCRALRFYVSFKTFYDSASASACS